MRLKPVFFTVDCGTLGTSRAHSLGRRSCATRRWRRIDSILANCCVSRQHVQSCPRSALCGAGPSIPAAIDTASARQRNGWTRTWLSGCTRIQASSPCFLFCPSFASFSWGGSFGATTRATADRASPSSRIDVQQSCEHQWHEAPETACSGRRAANIRSY